MSLNNLLRAYAICDLKRFCPPMHYWLRDHDPTADTELTMPLLERYASLGLTAREYAAADALCALATYETRGRAIWTTANPVRDHCDDTPCSELTQEQQTKIDARQEIYRCAALVYSHMVNDLRLIEWYQPIKQTHIVAPATQADEARPWLKISPDDPYPILPWYTPARYFARQLVRDDPTLLKKRSLLAQKVATSLAEARVYKRGGKKKLDGTTILKAFSNVSLE